MFVLVKMSEKVLVKPGDLRLGLGQGVSAEINRIYANKVIPSVGFCVALHSLESVSDAFIYANNGGAHVATVFGLVVLRPFVDEIILGTVAESSERGIRVSLDFFDDVWIPAANLRQPARFDAEGGHWLWSYSGAGDTQNDLPIYQDETIRLKVVAVGYAPPQDPRSVSEGLPQPYHPPMTVTGRVNGDGLGPTSWWR